MVYQSAARMEQIMIQKLKEEYKKLEGKPFWIIEEVPICKTVKLPGGHDHLGPLPDKVILEVEKYEYCVTKKIISLYTLDILLDEDVKCYFDEEETNWAMLNKERGIVW